VERHVGHHVDLAQRRIELDAVERGHLGVEQHDVGQMQIAMALAHAAIELPSRPGFAQGLGPCGDPRLERTDARAVDMAAQFPQHIAHGCHDALGSIAPGRGRRDRCLLVKPSQPAGEALQLFGQHAASRYAFAQQCARREAAHAQRVVDRFAQAVDARRMHAAADRHDAQV